MDAVDRAVDADAERAFVFLERLVAEPSVVGAEASAQAVLAEELDRLGFAVERSPSRRTSSITTGPASRRCRTTVARTSRHPRTR